MVPNGEVRILANESRDWARVLVELNFSSNSDFEKTNEVLEKSLARLAEDPRVKPYLLGEPEIFGWNDIKDWAVVVRMRAKVIAGRQAEVARLMRQFAYEDLREAGIVENK
jgi:small conductance mechanosensitive channel